MRCGDGIVLNCPGAHVDVFFFGTNFRNGAALRKPAALTLLVHLRAPMFGLLTWQAMAERYWLSHFCVKGTSGVSFGEPAARVVMEASYAL